MKIISAKNPKWANRSQTYINLVVKFDSFEEELPFTATANDTESHGRELFKRASQGEFGTVAPFSAIAPTIDEVVSSLKADRNKRLVASDWTQLPDVPQTTRDLWEPYRQALRDFPQQSDFPWYDLVVVETDFGYSVETNNAPWPLPPSQ